MFPKYLSLYILVGTSDMTLRTLRSKESQAGAGAKICEARAAFKLAEGEGASGRGAT